MSFKPTTKRETAPAFACVCVYLSSCRRNAAACAYNELTWRRIESVKVRGVYGKALDSWMVGCRVHSNHGLLLRILVHSLLVA
jgi:hypothetical protein